MDSRSGSHWLHSTPHTPEGWGVRVGTVMLHTTSPSACTSTSAISAPLEGWGTALGSFLASAGAPAGRLSLGRYDHARRKQSADPAVASALRGSRMLSPAPRYQAKPGDLPSPKQFAAWMGASWTVCCQISGENVQDLVVVELFGGAHPLTVATGSPFGRMTWSYLKPVVAFSGAIVRLGTVLTLKYRTRASSSMPSVLASAAVIVLITST